VLALAVALLATSCAAPRRGLVPLRTFAPVPFSDDGSQADLDAALEQSKGYYRSLPAETPIPFGDLTYTPLEMVRSLELFQALRQEPLDPESFRRQFQRKFLVFESIAESGENLFTGYYEPIIQGREAPEGEFDTPIYARPPDLVEVALDQFGRDLPSRRLMGRVEGGRLVPYFTRRDIQGRQKLKGVAKPLVYVNEVDLFFLQIQGSGRVVLPDGRTLRVGYDGSNGHAYRSLGAEMIRRELLKREDVTLQSIRGYLAQHPEAVPALLNSNPSYVFFRSLDEAQAPLGNLRLPLTPGRSLAADQRLLPPGSIAYVMTEVPVMGQPSLTQPLRRFMLVQDIGGAIRGHGRADLFWGAGPEAEWLAGHSKYPGRLFVVVARKEFLEH
jgi:membrane-bound lytic murein transglycosylase A